MHRTQIYLDGSQRKILKAMAAQQGMTLSALIRQAIWNLVAQYTQTNQAQADGLTGIVGLYRDGGDTAGSNDHDDIYG